MKLNFSDFAVIFEKIESPLEVGTLAELTLALLSKNIPFMNWKEVIDLLEILYSQANDITRQYPLDTAFELGKTIDCDQSDFFEFLSTQISTKFKYASIYFSILDSFISIRKDEITIDSLNPTIIMYLCLFVILKSGKCLNNLETLIPELKEPENIYNFIKTLNSNLHSPIARSILHKYHSIENVRTIICRFLICLIPNCSTNEARLNVNACVSVLQNDFESNIELISILYSSYIDLDPNTAIQSLGNFVSSLSKGWFIFSSPVKYVLIINLVFSILDKLEINIQSFYQFASEHLPEVTDLESSSIALKCLANTFRKIPKLDYEFPPKCRLFDFVIAASEPNNNDVFMCIASLLPIPPICPSEHIPIVTNLILKSKIDISDEMIQMLKSALLIAETPNDIKLLIEPFVEHIKENVPYSLLLSILESLSGQISKPKYSSDHFQIDNINSSQVNESEISDDFISLGIDTSSKLNENNDVSFDDFLSLMSETIGICLPLFEQTHLAVEFILIIMSKLTQKIEIKSKLSLHEAVKYISSTFNSQCLFNVASFLCHNQTMASVTAFIILLQERESEMLHCVHSFVSNLLNSKQPNISLIFEANETLAKAAASLITIDNFDIIKTALKNTKYASSIIDVLKEMLVSKCQELKMILDDPELTNLVDHESVEMQFVKVLTNSHPSDIEKWNEEKKLDFLSILETYINQLPKEQQLKFAHFVSNIQETNCIAKSIHIFSPFFKDNDFMTYFATSLLVLPVLIQTNENNIRALKYIIPISLQNKESLSVIKDYIHYVLLSLLKSSECIQNLKKQYNFEIILKPHLPLIISALLGPTNEEIVELFMLISNEKIEPHPNSFVSIIDICKTLKLDDISPNCIKTLIEKASKGTKTKNLCALVVLSYFCKRNILDEKITRQVLFLSQQLLNYDDQSEEVKTASLICLSCFPLNLLLSAK
ncbi:hypothetical protein TRFO_18375 [Tritrichomonas foetus]|uniref:Uncharacterized protein n=1 Tax=Tritrichomonas foetus TaxID=1144522 RepID=A0A1J4KQP6_9EUKA|nr:hypothetical protein TRFO_18375 [Tritrichomonas foetus]|eukprot:OHT11990.1 hypothetical protein TRFO_18375 [Tritrichomonas foetus]